MEPEDSTEAVLRIQSSLQKFIDTVNELETEDDPSGDGFTREFRILRELGMKMKEENTHPAEEGRKPCNIKKNRYKDIIPFDQTRVVLDKIDGEEGSDYINANYILDHTGNTAYIASQGPVPSTVNDFWRMIWQQRVKVMAMACRLVELGKKKCEQYWPSEVQEKQEFGIIAVTLLNEEDFAEHCTKRVMRIQKGDEIRLVTQFHYTGWPDHDIPNDIDDILEMMAMMREIKMEDPSAPMVIHCSAGCGRTGTICAIDYAWSLLRSGKLTEDFNLYEVVKRMREQRQSMIQAPEQYKCAHIAIKVLFEKHLQLMEEHDYGNVKFGEDEEEEESGYAAPNNIKPTRKISAMAGTIEKTIQQLFGPSLLDNDQKYDPTPVIMPQHAAPPPPVPTVRSDPTQQESVNAAAATESKPLPKASNKPPPLLRPDLARKPSVEMKSLQDKPPSPTVKQMVFAVEKIEHIPSSKGNPAQKLNAGGAAEKHVILDSQGKHSYSNVQVETHQPSIKSAVATNSSGTLYSQPVKPDRHSRIESTQEDNKFKTVISVGGPPPSKAPVVKSVSEPSSQGLSKGQRGSLKSKTFSGQAKPGVFEVPESSVPPTLPSQSADNVYSFAKDQEGHSYSTISSYSSGNGTQQASVMNTGLRDFVEPVLYNGTNEADSNLYSAVSKPVSGPREPTDSVYETVAVGQQPQVHVPPPIPDRNYEEEKPHHKEKPGSSDQSKKRTLGTLKQMITGARLFGSPSSENVATGDVPGFRVRLGQKPAGPKKTPASWVTTNTKL